MISERKIQLYLPPFPSLLEIYLKMNKLGRMLKSLHIRNYALIEELQTDFAPGLNIITGETGAGKSIIIDALGLVLGERADSDIVRKGSEKTTIEAVFGTAGNKSLKTFFQQNELEWNDDLIVRREVSVKGQSRCFVSDSPTTLSTMKEIGNALVDLHGQHEHQSLLRVDTHVDVLDEYGGLNNLRREFAEALSKTHATRNELRTLREREQQLKEKRELYGFQIREIDSINPRPNEEADLENELRILENAEKLFETTSKLYHALYEGENAVHDQLVLARNALEDLATIDTSFEEARNECAAAVAVVGELTKFIQQYNSRVEFNPQRLEEIRERLGKLTLLKKKYGGSIEAILTHRERIGRECELAENFESETARLQKRFEEERRAASNVAQRLSTKRQETARKVDHAILEALAELGITHGQFATHIDRRELDGEGMVVLGKKTYEATEKGIDLVEFFISTNAGEDPKPLAKVASGGEISRIMLAMKTILAKSDRLPVLIFDEIDVGVSGRIAQVVGKSLKNLSHFHQVVAITHLPQIAALADAHFVVEKMENATNGRAITRMRRLSPDERVREVATLMSGQEVTKAGMAGARELMGRK
jgi:DNA repair protein RecN (Recombination protein N)